MSKSQYGGGWTEEKLGALREYLRQWLTIFTTNPAAQHFTRHYVDAFAGSGLREQRSREEGPELFDFDEAVQYMDGSPKVALGLEEHFHRYWFVEKDPTAAADLRRMIESEFTGRSHLCDVRCEDANAFFESWCAGLSKSDRAVVFVDPFNMVVDWETIARLGQTRKVDLWILFPVMAVLRLLPWSGPREEWRERLNRTFGTEDWEDFFYKRGAIEDMFGDAVHATRDATAERVAEYFVERLKTEFHSVISRPRVLYGPNGSPLFFLAFAAANEKGGPIAKRIASHLAGRPR